MKEGEDIAEVLLKYEFTTKPMLLQEGIYGQIFFHLSAADKTEAELKLLMLAFPQGDEETDLFPTVSGMDCGCMTAGWSFQKNKMQDKTGFITCSLLPDGQESRKVTGTIEFYVKGMIVSRTGQAAAAVQETSKLVSESSYSVRTASVAIKKTAREFYLFNFLTRRPSAPTFPCSVFQSGEPVEITWESTGTYYRLFRGDEPLPIYQGERSEYVLQDGIIRDTTFTLEARSVSSQVYYYYLTTTVHTANIRLFGEPMEVPVQQSVQTQVSVSANTDGILIGSFEFLADTYGSAFISAELISEKLSIVPMEAGAFSGYMQESNGSRFRVKQAANLHIPVPANSFLILKSNIDHVTGSELFKVSWTWIPMGSGVLTSEIM